MRRRFLIGVLVTAVTAGCANKERPPPPSLLGVWKTDEHRLAELFEVTAAPQGPEADRALERVRRNHRRLRVEFTSEHVRVSGAGEPRIVPYRVLAWWGPLVQLEGLHPTGVVNTMLKVDGDHLTWFDDDGQIEFVLLRVSKPDP